VFVKCRHPISLKELILKPHIKLELKPIKQTRRIRGETPTDKLGGTGLANQFWAVLHFCCAGVSRDYRDFSRISRLSRSFKEKSGVSRPC
jgi:hypothetical protein